MPQPIDLRPRLGPQTDQQAGPHRARLAAALALPIPQLQQLVAEQLTLTEAAWTEARKVPVAIGPALSGGYETEMIQIRGKRDKSEGTAAAADPELKKKLLAEVYLRAYYLAEPAQLALAVARIGDDPIPAGPSSQALWERLQEAKNYLRINVLPANQSPGSLIEQIQTLAEELKAQKLQGGELWRYLLEVPAAVEELPGRIGHTVGQVVGGLAGGLVQGAADAAGGALKSAGWKIVLGLGGAGAAALAIWLLLRRRAARVSMAQEAS